METSEVTKSVWPQREDLPPPPHLELPIEPEEEDEDEPEVDLVEPVLELDPASDVIDDLEEVEVSQESIERAVELDQSMKAETGENKILAALPFGLLALIGAALGGYGIASQFGMVQSGATVESELAVFLPPFLILLGVLLFLVMGYYFIRTALSDD